MYFCNKGFILEGDAFRTCQENGEWSGEDPVCMRKSVPHGGEIVDDMWSLWVNDMCASANIAFLDITADKLKVKYAYKINTTAI